MADPPIPDDLKDFVIRHIDSVAHMEALLLLHGNPEAAWDVSAVAQRLYISEEQSSEMLHRLCDDGLLIRDQESFRLSESQRALVGRLALVYSQHLISITNMIHAKPRRIREFADAFKFRKGR